MAGKSTAFTLALFAGWGFAAGGAIAADSRASTNSMAGPVQANSGQQGDYSAVERDPFRACVAAHQNDPEVQQNCTWEGNYKPKH